MATVPTRLPFLEVGMFPLEIPPKCFAVIQIKFQNFLCLCGRNSTFNATRIKQLLFFQKIPPYIKPIFNLCGMSGFVSLKLLNPPISLSGCHLAMLDSFKPEFPTDGCLKRAFGYTVRSKHNLNEPGQIFHSEKNQRRKAIFVRK